jgi:hypothetical protein
MNDNGSSGFAKSGWRSDDMTLEIEKLRDLAQRDRAHTDRLLSRTGEDRGEGSAEQAAPRRSREARQPSSPLAPEEGLTDVQSLLHAQSRGRGGSLLQHLERPHRQSAAAPGLFPDQLAPVIRVGEAGVRC